MSNIDLKGKTYDLFRFSVTVYVIKIIDGKKHILVQKRKRYPYYDDITTVVGKIKKGELIKDAAKRKLKEETGLDIKDVKVLGILRKIRLNKKGDLVEDVVYNACYAENPKGVLQESNEWGENRWCDIDEFIEIQKKNIDYGPYDGEITLRIKNEEFTPFHFEQISTVRDY